MKVAIVGGGAAGTFAALAVQNRMPGADLTIFDPASAMARGIAHSFPQSWFRLNVPASKMGGDVEGNSTGFADWLMRNHGMSRAEYVTRFVYGSYLSDLLGDLVQSGSCQVEPDEVTSVRPLDGRRYSIIAGEKSLDADVVILCTGHLPPNRFLKEHPRIVADVWASGALDQVDPDDDLLVIGTGATAVDLVLTLDRLSHRGSITMISPHGNLPKIDAVEEKYPDFFDLKEDDRSPRSVLRRLRSEVEAAKQSGAAWQNVLDSFRHHVCGIWQGWSPFERKQFLRHGTQLWLVHRHRLPPDVAELLSSLSDSKKLAIRRARFKSLEDTKNGFHVQLIDGHKGSSDPQHHRSFACFQAGSRSALPATLRRGDGASGRLGPWLAGRRRLSVAE